MAKFLNLLRLRGFSTAADSAVEVATAADAEPRLKVDAGGKISWGSGATSPDTNLYRDEANVLKTDDTLKVPILFIDGIEVDTTGAASDQVLKFNGTKFLPGTASTVASLDDLTDVTITSVATNQVLKWNGTAWVNSNAASGLSPLDIDGGSDLINQIYEAELTNMVLDVFDGGVLA